MAERIPEEFIEELRSRTDIVDVISGYMHLTRKGNRYWGLCPFHGEKTPSFSVDGQRQFYYCFGCHQGGTVIQFVMEQEHLEFYEAIETLAERAGMQVPKTQITPKADAALRARAIEAATEAAKFFRDNLNSESGKSAMDYLLARDISHQAIRRFGLGFAPFGWDGLYAALKEKGFTEEEMLTAGLIVKKNDKFFDMFRARVMFPIFSRAGKVIAFGGRIIGDGQPKYLNSAETPIFNKRRNLYGLNFLKGVRNIGELILVEGYVDVVSLASHGVPACVATLGTAITQEQARIFKNYSANVTVCYDGDSAGQQATVRAIEILRSAGIEAKILELPGGQDPDDFIRANGAAAFGNLPRLEAVKYLLEREKREYDLSQQQGRTGYAMAAGRVLKTVEQPVVLEEYIKQLMIDTGFAREVLYEQVGRSSPVQAKKDIISNSPVNTSYKKPAALPQMESYIRAQWALIGILAEDGTLPEGLVRLEDFSDGSCAKVAGILLSAPPGGKTAYLLEALGDDAALRKEAARMLSEQEKAGTDDVAGLVRQYLRIIKMHDYKEEIRRLSERMETLPPEERAGVSTQIKQYMDGFSKLMNDRK